MGPCFGPPICCRKCFVQAVSRVPDSFSTTLLLPNGPGNPARFLFPRIHYLEISVETYFDYLRHFSHEIGTRIVEMYPALQGPNDPLASEIVTLLRTPLPAQALTISSAAKHLESARSVRVVGECGTGKTLMSAGIAHT